MRLGQLIVTLACTIGSCRSSTSPDTSLLVGKWTVSPYLNRDGSSYQSFLTLRADHSYSSDFQTDAPGAPNEPGELVAYSRSDGSFEVGNDSLYLHPVFLMSWDRYFNGGKEVVSRVDHLPPRPGQPDRRGAQYEVSATTLRLHYLTFPADAGVETETTYSRVR